jgi:hypothetical protein
VSVLPQEKKYKSILCWDSNRKRTWIAVSLLLMFNLSMCISVMPVNLSAHPADQLIASRFAQVAGVKIHHLSAGHGPAVILRHGYTQTSRMWKPSNSMLAEKFAIIAPDLPGFDVSEIPKDGLDRKSAVPRRQTLWGCTE